MFKATSIILAAMLNFPHPLAAQTTQESTGQKTIEISATEKVEVPAETATLKLGYQNQASSRDTAYTENTRTANKILQAFWDAGVPKEAIETEALSLIRNEERYEGKEQPAMFTASQQWQIQCKASEAQKIVDIAVAAGANQIESVDWAVADPQKLDDRASAALARAKVVAEQTAVQTGVKLGGILSVANSTNPAGRWRGISDKELVEAMVTARIEAAPMLKLQPGTVKREASVTITYAIAQ